MDLPGLGATGEAVGWRGLVNAVEQLEQRCGGEDPGRELGWRREVGRQETSGLQGPFS